MSDSNPPLLKANDIANQPEFEFHHPLNPNSEVYLRSLSRTAGLNRVAVTLARVPPDKESFIYHAHSNEEEWIYILSGQGIAEINDADYEVGPGDFMGFGLQTPHHLRNSSSEDLVYLVGGEIVKLDIGHFPHHGKRVIRDGETASIVDDEALTDFWSA